MKNKKFVLSFKNFLTNAKFKLKAKSPTILIVGGLISAGICVVTACVSTTKIQPVIEELSDEREHIEKKRAELTETEYTKKDIQKEKLAVYGKAALGFVKLYSVPSAAAILSVTSILAGCHILKARNAALAAAYMAINKSYKDYRKRVADRFGKDVELQIRSGVTQSNDSDENAEPCISEENEITTIKGYVGPDGFSEYAKVFDEASCLWEKDAEINFRNLKCKQRYWYDILQSRRIHTEKYGDIGMVFLNEICQDLDLPLTKAGQHVGWTWFPDGNNPIGDNYIDFGIFDVWRPKCADFINGYERNIVLDFNVDGVISNLL